MFATSSNLAKRRWLDTPVNSQGKIKRQKSSAKLKWPIFEEISKAEHDPFWKEYWIRASRGKFPPGFSFNGNELFYSYRKKVSKVTFSKDVADSCQLAKHMYQENSSIYSPLDMKHINQRKEVFYSNRDTDIKSWSDCNNSQKAGLITHFLVLLAREYQLSTDEKNALHQTLNVGVNIGAFNTKNIIIENNKIVDILGLEWSDEKEMFYIDTKQAPFKIKKPSKTTSRKKNGYCLYSNWLKLNDTKSSNKDKILEIKINDISTSAATSYYQDGYE